MKYLFKKIQLLLLVSFVLLLLTNQETIAQKKKRSKVETRNNVIKPRLLGPLYGYYGLAYERVITEKISLGLTLGIWNRDLTNIYDQFAEEDIEDFSVRLSGINFIPEFRYYLSKKGAPRGFYIGAYIPYQTYKFSGSGKFSFDNPPPGEPKGRVDADIKFSIIGGGFMLGSQWLIKDRISIEPFFGIGVAKYSIDGLIVTIESEELHGGQKYKETQDLTDDIPSTFLNRIFPTIRLGLNIGIAF